MASDREIGKPSQDEFTQQELAQMLQHYDLQRGAYILDVGSNGKMKLSRMQKRWVQREDLVRPEG